MQPEPSLPPPLPPLSPKRPTLVTVLAILAIIGGSVGIISWPLNFLHLIDIWPSPPPVRELINAPFFQTPLIFSITIAPIIAVAWLATGIALYRLRKWARSALITLCIIAVIQHIAFASFFLAIAPDFALTIVQLQPHPIPGFESFLTFLIIISVILSVLFTLAWSLTFILLLTRPKVVAAFRQFGS